MAANGHFSLPGFGRCSWRRMGLGAFRQYCVTNEIPENWFGSLLGMVRDWAVAAGVERVSG